MYYPQKIGIFIKSTQKIKYTKISIFMKIKDLKNYLFLKHN